MSEQNTNLNEDVIEVPVTTSPVEEQEVSEDNILDLQDVGYMVMIGRTKDGETFFRTVGINDLLVIDGLVGYAKRKLDRTFDKHFELEEK
jgi:hypothetical protein